MKKGRVSTDAQGGKLRQVAREQYGVMISSAYSLPNSGCVHKYQGADPLSKGCEDHYLPYDSAHPYVNYRNHISRQFNAYLDRTTGKNRLGFAIMRLDTKKPGGEPVGVLSRFLQGCADAVSRVIANRLL